MRINYSRYNLIRMVTGASLIAVLIVGYLAIYQDKRSYMLDVRTGKEDVARIVDALTEQINLTFLSTDLMLKRALDRNYINQLFGDTLHSDMQYNLQLWVKETPHIAALALTDPVGKITILSRKEGLIPFLKEGAALGDTEYYRYHRDNGTGGLQINRLVVEQGKFILFTRRIEDIEGRFAGIIIAAIDARYIAAMFAMMEKDAGMQMFLHLQDGVLLAERSEQGSHQYIEQKIIHTPPAPEPAIYNEMYQGKIVFAGLKQVPAMPVVVSVIADSKKVLQHTRTNRAYYLILLGVLKEHRSRKKQPSFPARLHRNSWQK
jgi:hypothetical protein